MPTKSRAKIENSIFYDMCKIFAINFFFSFVLVELNIDYGEGVWRPQTRNVQFLALFKSPKNRKYTLFYYSLAANPILLFRILSKDKKPTIC